MGNVIAENTLGKNEVWVSEENTAKTLGSGSLDVFSTPAMILLMEKTAAESVEPLLDEGFSTVGSLLEVSHLSPSPIGMKIVCETKVLSQDRAKIVFEVKAYDEKGLIGEGKHERFIINKEKFMAKAEGKKND